MRKKIIVAIVLNAIAILVSIETISYLTVREEHIDRSLENTLALAKIVSNCVEVFLSNNLERLQEFSHSAKINLNDSDWLPEQRMLETAYRYSLFTEGVFLLDKHGNKVLTYPPHIESFSNLSYITYVNQVLQHGKPVISNVYTMEPVKKRVIFMLTPLRDRSGALIGIAGGILSPMEEFLNTLLQSAKTVKHSYVEIIDSNEIVIASDTPKQVLQRHDHNGSLSMMIKEGKTGVVECRHGLSHGDTADRPTDLLALVPLQVAPWAVVVGDTMKDVFAPSIGLQKEFILFVLVLICASIVVSIMMSKHIAKPLTSLMSSVNRIASGDLSTPIGNLGSDEILTLSKSFDAMRLKLSASLDKIRAQNQELEIRVAKRTREIRESRRRIEHLLKKVISSQEDEQRRIARDLHDTILQDISALLIRLEICKLEPEGVSVEAIDDMREIVTKTIDSVHTVIKDLRPTLLDDLGIDAAIMWLVNKHLTKRGIKCHVEARSPIRKRLPSSVEVALFRILQEAIINITRHANAQNVYVALQAAESALLISIEDDGDGFDIHDVMRLPSENGRGLGIMGMKERASLVEARLDIFSLPGKGTRLCVEIPLTQAVDDTETACAQRT
jgi:two-component system sensor histidine kinase UhpB